MPALALLNASFLLRDILLHWPLRWLAGCHLHSMDSSIHLSSWMALILLSHAALHHPVHLSSLMSSFQILTCLHFWSAKLLIILRREGRVQVGDYCQVLAGFDGNAGVDMLRSSSLGWEYLFPCFSVLINWWFTLGHVCTHRSLVWNAYVFCQVIPEKKNVDQLHHSW